MAMTLQLSFSVKDTGIGISAEKHPLLFQAFRQVDGSMTRAKGGTGLGLAISRQLTELMGGTIDLDSELGRGSRFHFTIRCQRSSRDAQPEPRRLGRKLRLLVAEPNAVTTHVLSSCFLSWGLDPVFTGTVEEARRAWQHGVESGNGFDVAILDVKGLRKPASPWAIKSAPLRRDGRDLPGRYGPSFLTEKNLKRPATASPPNPCGHRGVGFKYPLAAIAAFHTMLPRPLRASSTVRPPTGSRPQDKKR